MASILRGNCLIAQSGSPTATVNSSLAGLVQEALQYEEIEEVYGALNGLIGILNEELIDLTEEKNRTIEGLKYTPAAVLGSSFYKLKDASESREDYQRIIEVFQAHNIRYFFYIGGNHSMEIADKVNKAAQEAGYEVRVIGVPKAVDNELVHTDHCPGYGSALKYLCTVTTEIGRDNESMYPTEPASVIEVMGRNGWLASGTVLARQSPEDAPHIILIPEIPFNEEKFIGEVAKNLTQYNRVVIVVSDGLKDAQGKFLSQVGGSFSKDMFGHPQLGGVSEVLRRIIEDKVGVKCRTSRIGLPQRCAGHLASKADVDSAVLCGQAAVKAAIEGKSGYMITLQRVSGDAVSFTTGLTPLLEVSEGHRAVPREWFDEEGTMPNETFIQYLRPLIQGEVAVPQENGLPKYVRLERHAVEKKCLLREAPAGA